MSLYLRMFIFWDDSLKQKINTLRKSLQTTSALSATLKLCFEQPAASFLVCSLIFIEYSDQKNQRELVLFFDNFVSDQLTVTNLFIAFSIVDNLKNRFK